MKMPKKQYLSYNIGKSEFASNKFNAYEKVWFTTTGQKAYAKTVLFIINFKM